MEGTHLSEPEGALMHIERERAAASAEKQVVGLVRLESTVNVEQQSMSPAVRSTTVAQARVEGQPLAEPESTVQNGQQCSESQTCSQSEAVINPSEAVTYE